MIAIINCMHIFVCNYHRLRLFHAKNISFWRKISLNFIFVADDPFHIHLFRQMNNSYFMAHAINNENFPIYSNILALYCQYSVKISWCRLGNFIAKMRKYGIVTHMA